MHANTLHGAGLGLRRERLPDLMGRIPDAFDFFESLPRTGWRWVDHGGANCATSRSAGPSSPTVCPSTWAASGQAPLDEIFLQRIKRFLDEYAIPVYTEYLAWCTDDGHL